MIRRSASARPPPRTADQWPSDSWRRIDYQSITRSVSSGGAGSGADGACAPIVHANHIATIANGGLPEHGCGMVNCASTVAGSSQFTRHSVPLAVTMLLAAACGGAPTPRPSDFVHERITVVEALPDGTTRIGFEFSQRWFLIDPVQSPDAKALAAFAASAKAGGQPVHATVKSTGDRVKGDDGPAFVLLRLADTPDPNR